MEEELPLPARWAVQLLGPPLLTLPYVVHEVGYGQTLIQFALTLGLSWAGFHCLVEATHYTMAHSLRELVEKLSGRRLGVLVQAMSCLFDVGRAAGLVAVSSDSIVALVRSAFRGGEDVRDWEVTLALSGLCFLLCLIPGEKTGGLRKVFSASGLFVLTLVFVVLARFAQAASRDEDAGLSLEAFPGGLRRQLAGFFHYAPAFAELYAIHDAIPAQLQRVPGPPAPKKAATRALLGAGVLVSTLAYGCVGVLASAVCGAGNAPNVFDALLGDGAGQDANSPDPAGSASSFGFVNVFYVVYAALLAVGVPVTLGPLNWQLADLFHRYGRGWAVFYAFGLCAAVGALSLVPSVLELSGCFSALCGLFVCVLPVLLAFYRLPELRAKYRFMDQLKFVQNEDTAANIRILDEGRASRTSIARKSLSTGSAVDAGEYFVDELPLWRRVVCWILLAICAVVHAWSLACFLVRAFRGGSRVG